MGREAKVVNDSLIEVSFSSPQDQRRTPTQKAPPTIIIPIPPPPPPLPPSSLPACSKEAKKVKSTRKRKKDAWHVSQLLTAASFCWAHDPPAPGQQQQQQQQQQLFVSEEKHSRPLPISASGSGDVADYSFSSRHASNNIYPSDLPWVSLPRLWIRHVSIHSVQKATARLPM